MEDFFFSRLQRLNKRKQKSAQSDKTGQSQAQNQQIAIVRACFQIIRVIAFQEIGKHGVGHSEAVNAALRFLEGTAEIVVIAEFLCGILFGNLI